MTKNKAATWLYLFVIFISNQAFAAGSFVVSGQINKPDGTPLESATVNFTVEIRDSAAGTCVIWKETFSNTDLTASGGNFGLTLGAGVRVDAGLHPLSDVFVNQKTFSSSGSCPGGYTPTSGAERSLKISFDDSGGATQTLSSQSVKPVPAASAVGDYGPANLAKVSGVGSANVLLPTQFDFLYNLTAPAFSSSTPCSPGNVLQYSGSSWGCATIGGSGTVTNVTSANGDIVVANGSSTPQLTLNSGTGVGQIVKLDATAKLPAVDGSALTNLNANNLGSGTVPAARLPSFTGDVTSSGTTTSITALARTKLASGTANHVLINDSVGSLSSEASLAISRGGTGATTANGALNALLPSQASANGKVLSSNGTDASWVAPSGGLPALAGTAAAPGYAFSGNITTGVFSPTTNMIGFSTAGNERARFDAAGNLGIGTTAPGSALDVKGTLRLSGSISGYVGLAPAAAAGSTTYTLPSADGGAGQFLSTNGAGLLSWGNPGGATLSSLGAASGTSSIDSLNFAQSWNWSTATTQSLMFLSANALTSGSLLSMTTTNATLNSTNGLLYVANVGASTSGMVARIQSSSTAGSGLTVLANGNVGIGTTTPAAKLDVAGAIKVAFDGTACGGSFAGAQRYNAGTMEYCNGSLWQAYGVAGAGVTSINGQTGSVQAFSFDAVGTDFSIVSSSGTHNFHLPSASSTARGALTSTDWTTFNNKLGPSSSFNGDVSGTAASMLVQKINGTTVSGVGLLSNNLLQAVSALPSNSVLVTNGIGTGVTALSIGGGGAVVAGGGIPTWAAAGAVGTVLTSTGTASAPVWASVLPANPGTATSPGYAFNSDVGSGMFSPGINQLGLVTSGIERIRIDSSGRVGIGNAAPAYLLDVSADANFNGIQIGLGGGLVSTNTRVGAAALVSNTSGNTNTAIGYNSLNANTTGGGNTGVGYNALNFNQTGTFNTAVGYSAVRNATSGGNTGLGYSALLGVTSGTGNLGIGQSSGSSITTGNYNVVIGSNNGSAIATTSNNILISDGQGNERLRIISSGNVGIGTTTPASTLDVTGTTNVSGVLTAGALSSTSYTSPTGILIQPGTGSLLELKSADSLTDVKINTSGFKIGVVAGATGVKNLGLCSGTSTGATSGTVFAQATKVVTLTTCSGLTIGGSVNCSPSVAPGFPVCTWNSVITAAGTITITILNISSASQTCFSAEPTWSCLVATQ